MKHYNLYYKNECINTFPLTENELLEIINKHDNKVMHKYNSLLNKISTIDKNRVRVVECTIV